MKGIIMHHGDAPVMDLGGGTSRRVLAFDRDLMAVEVSFETGAAGAMHSHPHTQCSYVLSGVFRYTVENESAELRPGDSVVVPGGLPHGTLCLEAGTLLDIFTPMREDFVS